MSNTGFFWDERCFWHAGGNYAATVPLGGLMQPLAAGGLPENPETKRRLKNLMDVTGLSREVAGHSAAPATTEDLLRVHPRSYLDAFKSLSEEGGGEIGLRSPFAAGGFEIAALSAGLAKAALAAVLGGEHRNAYALSRPPGHHCLPDFPNGFCLLANIAVAIEAARAEGIGRRFAVLDWDVHHGNGTQHIFFARDDVLTISIHQENNYPPDSGAITERGEGAGAGHAVNVPLPPGCGDETYVEALARIALPAIRRFAPDVIIVACGFDASGFDPLAHMLVSADGFGRMTRAVMELADEVCQGRVVMVHEGGYSEVYVPFCGHRVIAELAASDIEAHDPLAKTLAGRQPNARMVGVHRGIIAEYAEFFGLG